ncbi:MAG: hypothetical protein V4507_10755 [Verrucomicrobiota bacterium]
MSDKPKPTLDEAKAWFLGERQAELEKWTKMPTGTKDEMRASLDFMREFNMRDARCELVMSQASAGQTVSTKDYDVKVSGKSPARSENPTFYVNPDVDSDIKNYRGSNPELDSKVKVLGREELENEYILKVMKRGGYEPTINVKDDIAKYKADHPSLDSRAKIMSRERLENELILKEMKKVGYDPQIARYKAFFDKPENAHLKKQLENLTAHIRNPQKREEVMFREKAPVVAKANGIKI